MGRAIRSGEDMDLLLESGFRSGSLTETAPDVPAGGRRHGEIAANAVIAQTTRSRLDSISLLPVPSETEGLVISHMSRNTPGHGMTERQAKRAGYTACVHLREFGACELWRDGIRSASGALAPGSIHINDMRHGWLADLQGAFDVVNFYIPQSALDEITDDQGSGDRQELRCPIEDGHIDVVVRNLAMALLPAMSQPEQANRLFLDHAWRAVTAHLVRAYGSADIRPRSRRGGLAPWQERRAKEMLLAELSGNVSLPDLARACRLSCSHFSQAFRQTVGCPPHQWLLSQRIERSKQLILNSDQPLSQIALAAGFADQSHFTRVFSRIVKTSPAAWARAQDR
jgi:AraC-like DNA-binding protein